MKKIYILAAAALFSTAAIAQVSETGKAFAQDSKAVSVKHNNNKVANDTLGWVPNSNWLPSEFAVGGQVWNFGYTGGGYVYGTNISTNEINHVAQGYQNLLSASIGVEGLITWFIGKDGAGGGNSTMTFNLMTMAANSANEGTSPNFTMTALGPNGTALSSATLGFAAADTTWPNVVYVPFPSVTGINGDFAITFDATAVKAANDTIGLTCDADGEGFRLAYHKAATNNEWYVTNDLFGGALNNNIALFPVIDDTFVGIDDQDFFNGMQLSAFPNPVVDQTTISYNLSENMNEVKLIVYDMTGKKVHNVNYGSQAKGSYNVVIDASAFTSGNYFYSLLANGQRLTKRMVVTK